MTPLELKVMRATIAYNEGKPIMSDAEWDELFANEGSDSLGLKGKIKLPYRMGSLKKLFIGEDALPSSKDLEQYIESVKLDGCAAGLLYKGGILQFAATRGDGDYGQHIVNDKIKLLASIPLSIPNKNTLWITGELVAPSTIENSRNYVAGFLNSKQDFLAKSKDIVFVAYDVRGDGISDNYVDALKSLEVYNVLTFDATDYPTDGTVYRLLDNKEYNALGFTGNYKNGAFAIKTRSAGVETTLLDITWQTGKSGKVTPVAILEPVMIGDAKVSRATLHNFSFIEGLGLYPNARVVVERSGEIIPRIIGLAVEA